MVCARDKPVRPATGLRFAHGQLIGRALEECRDGNGGEDERSPAMAAGIGNNQQPPSAWSAQAASA
jgi:hypothetical protein